MPYRFDRDESVQEAIERCAREQLDRAIAELDNGIRIDPVEAVHGARRAVKKERALLRLARGAMPRKLRRYENAALRDATSGLSDARDQAVMIETLDKLAERFVGQVPDSTFNAVRDRLSEQTHSQNPDGRPSEDVVEELRAVRERIDGWELERGGWRAFGDGLERSYRRGRRAAWRAIGERSDEALHEWRKRVKDLSYQLRLLAPICGPVVRGQAKEAAALADRLGDDHDLALLRSLVERGTPGVAIDDVALVRLIDHRRGELQTAASYAGKRLYAENPKAFARRIRRYWRAGRGAASAEHEHRPAELARTTRAPAAA